MNKTRRIAQIILIALLYVIAARVGQAFAIEPGNVTAIWIPSGLMVALTFRYGLAIWPGVFLGAFIGNIWAYFSTESVTTALAALCAASLNGIGDVLACVGMAYLVMQRTLSNYPFTSIRHYVWYLALAIIAGPMISALFGVSGLTLFQFIPPENYFDTFIVWFVGDASGVMIFGPLLSAWLHEYQSMSIKSMTALSIPILYCGFTCAVLFDLIVLNDLLNILIFLTMPAVLFMVLYHGQRTAFTILFVIATISIYATSEGKGFFAAASTDSSFLFLQSFLAIFSLNIYTLAIFLHDKQAIAAKLNSQKIELERLYRQDQLTGTWNRYRIKEFIEMEISRFERYGQIFGLIMFDIDDFKAINDQQGHLTGDKILVSLSHLIKSEIRESDLFGRWGGEEFVIVLTNSSMDDLQEVAEKVRRLVEKHDFGVDATITISLGATVVQSKDTLLTLLDRADDALYQAKKSGKNRTCLN